MATDYMAIARDIVVTLADMADAGMIKPVHKDFCDVSRVAEICRLTDALIDYQIPELKGMDLRPVWESYARSLHHSHGTEIVACRMLRSYVKNVLNEEWRNVGWMSSRVSVDENNWLTEFLRDHPNIHIVCPSKSGLNASGEPSKYFPFIKQLRADPAERAEVKPEPEPEPEPAQPRVIEAHPEPTPKASGGMARTVPYDQTHEAEDGTTFNVYAVNVYLKKTFSQTFSVGIFESDGETYKEFILEREDAQRLAEMLADAISSSDDDVADRLAQN